MDMGALMKLMGAAKTFQAAHPKFAQFAKTMVSQGIAQGDVIEVTVTKADGRPITANMRVQASDLELLQSLRSLKPNG